ncbi:MULTISPECIES: hypothetical protein [Sphingobacterium]|uniref:hypothetical protein n=1 Tax=Sphingobacterium TaxID=28453 RepID=UPI002580BBAB|nr:MULTISPECIES: hypothetical protein [Sphingobacterium]
MRGKQPQKANETSIKKGEVRNPNGRPKGSENKRTKEVREAYEEIMQLLEKRMMDGDDVIKSLSPSKASELYWNLLGYKKPKLSANKIEQETNVKGDVKINISFGDLINSSTEEENEDNNNE